MDYKGEPSPLNWPCINSHFGVLDIAAFEKDSAGYYKAWWMNDTAHAYLLPGSWNHPPGTVLPEVIVFAAASYAELFINGASLGMRAILPFDVARWSSVAFEPGNISAITYDASNATLATALLSTTGAPTSLRLSADAGSATISADGSDVSLLRLEIVDAAGALVPDASPLVTWAVTSGPGALIGLANGDPSDLTPDKVGHPELPYGGVWARPAYHGLARAIVQGSTQPGSIVVTASAAGLAPATFTVTTQ